MLKRPIWNTIAQIGGKIITVLLSLVTTGILTRELGASVYGNYLLITSVFLLFDSLADFGTRSIGVREAARAEGKKRNEIYIQVAWVRLITSLLAFLIGLILIFGWAGFSTIKMEALVALMMIFFTSMAGSLEIIFQTEIRMELKVLMDILFPVLFLVMLLIWPLKINLLWVMLAYLVARILSLNLGWGLVKKILGEFKIKLLNKTFLKIFLKESWPMGLYMILFTGYDRAVDSVLIKQFFGAEKVAFYGLAYKIYSSLVQPAYYFVNSIFPLMSGNSLSKRDLFKKSFWLIAAGLVILVPTVYYLSPWIVETLAGSGFGESVVVLRILLLALIFAYVSHLFGFSLIAKGGQKSILVIGIISLLVNVSGNLILIPRFGIEGAAWMTVATEGLASILMLGVLIKRFA